MSGKSADDNVQIDKFTCECAEHENDDGFHGSWLSSKLLNKLSSAKGTSITRYGVL